ncbi:MAG: PEGA domain-containing protein [Myxococcales bacterium]
MGSSIVSCFGAWFMTGALARGTVRFLVVVGVLLALGAGPAQAQSGDAQQAKALFEQGLEASDSERWAEAADYFTRSRALLERPSTVFNLVGALYRLGRYREGLAAAVDYLALSNPVADAAKRKEIESLRENMAKAVGTARIEVAPADANVDLDGEALTPTSEGYTLQLDPGVHGLVARREGYRDLNQSFVLERGASVNLRVQLEPSSEPAAVETGSPPLLAEGPNSSEPSVPAPKERSRKRLRRALWITGAVLVAGGVATAVALALRPEPECKGGSTGFCLE